MTPAPTPPNPNGQSGYRHLLRRYARYAPVYDRKFARYSAGTLARVLELITKAQGGDGNAHDGRGGGGGGALLDVACGTGIFIDMLRRQRPNIRTVGVDVSPQMLQRAKERVPPDRNQNVEWMVGQAERLPVGSAEFDIVTCSNAFHLVQDAPAALAEFRRALKPGGTLILVDWCRDYPQMAALKLMQKFTDRHQRHIRTVAELSRLIRAAGFELHKTERFLVRPLWGMMRLVAMKPAEVRSQRTEIRREKSTAISARVGQPR